MRRKKCRFWWPTNLSSSSNPINSNTNTVSLLFGWCISSTDDNCDIIVAFARDESVLTSNSNLQEILNETNQNMSLSLQEKSTFSILGYCVSDLKSLEARKLNEKHGKSNCLLRRFDNETALKALKSNKWVEITCDYSNKVSVFPRLHHIHWNKDIITQLDLHVIIYEVPKLGFHHYSLDSISQHSEISEIPFKLPKWVENLHKKPSHLDLHTVILAINSVNATDILFRNNRKSSLYHIFCMVSSYTWKFLAVLFASYGTLIYIILQTIYKILGFFSSYIIYVTFTKIFRNTFQNMRIRCSQFLYWPIYLQDSHLSGNSQTNVEYAEKNGIYKHSIWSNLTVDIILGNILGFLLYFEAEKVCLILSSFTDDINNYVLRTGCVWLMGNPAGFKLNTELAGVLGMISLTVVQIWSTLWFLMSFLFIYVIKIVAILSILFGVTTPSALIIDSVVVVTRHLSALHWLISVLYSWQILAIAALWRLFRGRKWNPLRERLDSYEYTVQQHIVGSLIFTPLLLLLPTTSGFYIFFTIMISTINTLNIAIEVLIFLIHSTPFNSIFLWLMKKTRFPFGIWFEIISSSNESPCLVSFLHSNFLSLGAVVWPHYRCIFEGFSRSSMASSAYGVLTGKRVPLPLKFGFPRKLEWVSIPWREYWWLCHDSLIACKKECKCHLLQ